MTRSLGTATGRIILDTSSVDQAVGKMRTAMGQAEAAMGKAGQAAGKAGKDIGSGFAPAVKAFDGLKQAATQLAPALAGLATVGGVVAALKSVVSTSASFQTAITRVGAVSGASAHELEGLSAVARDLGAKTSFSASQAAEGMQYLAMAGFSVNEVTAAMPGLLDAAAASQMDLGRTADIVSNVLTGFGLEAGEAGRVADVLVYTSNNANTNVEQLGQAMKYAAPVAASLGISIEDTAAAIGRMSGAGIQGEMAGTALRGALVRLSAPSREAEGLMKSLGLNLFTAEGSMKSLPEVIAEFERALGGMTQQQQTAALQTIVGTEAMAGFLGLMGAGSDNVADFSDAIGASAGTAAAMGEVMGQTFAMAMEELSGAVEEVALTLGEILLPILNDLVRGVTVAVRSFGEWLKATQTFAQTYEDLLLPALNGVVAALTVYALKVAVAQGAAATMIPVLWAKTAAMGKLAVATLAASGPFVVLAAAVAGATLVYRKWQSIADDAAQKWLDQNETYQDSITQLGRYEAASVGVKDALRSEANELRSLQAEQEEDIRLRAEAAKNNDKDAAWWDASTKRINARTDRMRALSGAIGETITRVEEYGEAEGLATQAIDTRTIASVRAGEEAARAAQTEARAQADLAVSYGDIDGALAILRANSGLTTEELDELLEKLQQIADKGREAFRSVVDAQASWYTDREQSAADHEANVTAITEEYTTKRNALVAELAAATTDEEKANLTQQIADLDTAHADKLAKTNEAFAAQQRAAAIAYAQQQAAQLAHLGQMLIDYVRAQAVGTDITDAQLGEMTNRIAAQYGVQRDLVDESYDAMLGSLDRWVAGGGENIDEHLADLGTVTDNAVQMQRDYDRIFGEMVDQLLQDFNDGKLNDTELTRELVRVRSRASDAAAALNAIPKRIETTVAIKTEGKVPNPAPPGGLERRAAGGPILPRRSYLVGEQGPEVVVPAAAGMVYPHDLTRQLQTLQTATRPVAPAVPAAPRPVVFSPQITINHPMLDTAARLAELQHSIIAAARRASADVFGRAVDGLILGGVNG